MEREDKPLQLRPVDDDVVEAPTVIRLGNRPSQRQEPEEKPIRLGSDAEKSAISRRLDLPTREDVELRTHQPGIEAIIESEAANPDHLEQNWGEASSGGNPIPWGWFALIALAIIGTVIWSLTRLQQAAALAEKIRMETESSLVHEAKEEREAGELIARIEQAIRDFFNTASVEARARLVRHPERVAPLMRQYYSDQAVFSERLQTIKLLQPLTLDHHGNFWRSSVVLANGKTHNLVVEIMESGEARIDWETLVCYQPIPWDDFVARKPAETSLDFRVYVERDSFFSHEFADGERWACFQLTALQSKDKLFGYAPATSEEARSLLSLLDQNGGRRTALILRLTFPAGLQSRRGVMIEKLLSTRWLYIDSPASGS
jgi:hypothetical protein